MNHQNDQHLQAVMRTSMIGMAGNITLALLKGLAGVLSGSDALIGDAVHSAADLSSGVIVMLGTKLSAREADSEHPFGHERFECVAAIVLAIILLITGLLIGMDAVDDLKTGEFDEVTGRLALAAACLSVVIKEILFRYTKFCSKKYESGVLRADAWHHRSDALCSLGVLVGVAGSRLGLRMMESAASLMICAFIIRAALEIFRDGVRKMVDHTCGDELEEDVRSCAVKQDGVLSVKNLKTREFGSRAYVEIEIGVDGKRSLEDCDHIARRVHDAIEARVSRVKHVIVCAKPEE